MYQWRIQGLVCAHRFYGAKIEKQLEVWGQSLQEKNIFTFGVFETHLHVLLN